MKDFAPLQLGTVDLTTGRGELTLQATDIPGDGVIDVRCVQLTLLNVAE